MADHSSFRPQMSLYIPSVRTRTTEEDIKRVFYNLNLGFVSRVDFVEKEGDPAKFMAFVHFEYWFFNDVSYYLQERIKTKGKTRIVYNDPHYWLVMENKNPRTKTEVMLEREIDHLKKRISYLEIVAGNHTRKFMDNGITTQTQNCAVCWLERPNDIDTCPACEDGDSYEQMNLLDALKQEHHVVLETSESNEEPCTMDGGDADQNQDTVSSWSFW